MSSPARFSNQGRPGSATVRCAWSQWVGKASHILPHTTKYDVHTSMYHQHVPRTPSAAVGWWWWWWCNDSKQGSWMVMEWWSGWWPLTQGLNLSTGNPARHVAEFPTTKQTKACGTLSFSLFFFFSFSLPGGILQWLYKLPRLAGSCPIAVVATTGDFVISFAAVRASEASSNLVRGGL